MRDMSASAVGRAMWESHVDLSVGPIPGWDALWPDVRDTFERRAAVLVEGIRTVQGRPTTPQNREGLILTMTTALCEEFGEFSKTPGGIESLSPAALDSHQRRVTRAVDALIAAGLLIPAA